MYDIASVYEANSVRDAIEALVRLPDAELISGGTDVLIRLRSGKGAGCPLVSIHDLEEIKGVKLLDNGDILIGAGTTFSRVTGDPVIREYLPMLGEAVDTVGGPQIRNMGTIGGNVCNGATSADSAATLCTLEAEIVLEGPEGEDGDGTRAPADSRIGTGKSAESGVEGRCENGSDRSGGGGADGGFRTCERTVPILEFYTGPGRTVRRHAEVCKYFRVRRESIDGWYGKYIKYGKRRAMEIATLGCAVRVKLSEDRTVIEDVRLAYGVAAPTPIRCKSAEAALRGSRTDDADAMERFVEAALGEVHPRSSWRASKEFRLQLIAELARRALAEAVVRAGGKPAYEVGLTNDTPEGAVPGAEPADEDGRRAERSGGAVTADEEGLESADEALSSAAAGEECAGGECDA